MIVAVEVQTCPVLCTWIVRPIRPRCYEATLLRCSGISGMAGVEMWFITLGIYQLQTGHYGLYRSNLPDNI